MTTIWKTSSGWNDLSGSSNFLKQTYINGFLDVSNIFTTRSDASMVGNVTTYKMVNINNDINIPNGVINQSINSNISYNSIDYNGINTLLDVSANSTLYVSGDISLNGKLFIAYDMCLNSRLFVIGDSSINQTVTIQGNHTTNNETLNGNLIMNSNIISLSDVSLNSRLFVKGDISLNGNIYVNNTITNGDISLNSRLFIGSDASFSNRLFVGSDASFSNRLFVGFDASFNNRLWVSNDASFGGNVSINGNLNVGISSANNNVLGNTTVGNITITGNSTINNNETISGIESINGVLTMGTSDVSMNNSHLLVSGDVSFNKNLYVLSDVSINSRILLGGDASLNGNVYIGKDLTIAGYLKTYQYSTNLTVYTVSNEFIIAEDLSVNGRLNITSDVSTNLRVYVGTDSSFGGKIYVANKSYLVGDLSINNRLLIQVDSSLNSRLFVASDVYLNKRLFVGGDTSMNGNLFVSGLFLQNNDISLNTRLLVGGDSFINGRLIYNNDASYNNRLFVGSDVSLNKRLFVTSDVSVNGNINIYGNLNISSTYSNSDYFYLNKKSTLAYYYAFESSDVTNNNVLNRATGLYDASLVSGASLTTSNAKVGASSLYLDATTSQYMKINNITTSGTSGYTISLWFKTGTAATWARIFDFGNGSSMYNILLTYAGTGTYLLANTRTTTPPATELSYDANPYGNAYAVNDNVWRHFVWTCSSAGVWNFYLNGSLYSTITQQPFVNTTRTSNFLGKSNWAGDAYFTGYIDEFRMYNEALTATDILNLYNYNPYTNHNIAGNIIFTNNTCNYSTVNNNETVSGVETILGGLIVGNTTLVNDTSLNGRLYVYADTSLNSILYVGSDLSINNRLFLASDASLSGKLFVVSDLSVNGNLFFKTASIPNSAILTSSLYFTQTTDVSSTGRLFITGDSSLNGNLYVGGSRIGFGVSGSPYNIDMSGTMNIQGQVVSGITLPDNSQLMTATPPLDFSNNFAMNFSLIPTYGTVYAAWYGSAMSFDGKCHYAISFGWGYRVLQSFDYGMNWNINTNIGNLSWSCIGTSANGQYITVGDNSQYVYTSSNYGSTWTNTINSAGSNFRSIAMSSTGQYQVIANQSNYFYLSTNYGVTWQSITNASTSTPSGGAISSNGKYITLVGTGNSNISVSNNYGLTWNIVSVDFCKQVKMSSNGQYQTVIGNGDNGNVYQSTNYGVSWIQNTFTTLNWKCVAMSSNGQYQIVGGCIAPANTIGKIYKSVDFGNSWALSNFTTSSQSSTNGISMSSNGQYVLLACVGTGIYTSTTPYINLIGTNQLTSYGDASLNTRLFLGGDASLNGNLTVTNYTTLTKQLTSSFPVHLSLHCNGGVPTMYNTSGTSVGTSSFTAGNFYFFLLPSNNNQNWTPTYTNNCSLNIPYTGLYMTHFTYFYNSTNKNSVHMFISKSTLSATNLSSPDNIIACNYGTTESNVTGTAYLTAGSTLSFGFYVNVLGGTQTFASAIRTTISVTLIQRTA